MPDYSIPMQTREIRIKTPSEAMREAAATKNAMMAVQDQQESRARKQRMNALYEQSGGDIDAMLQSGGLDMDTAIQLHGIKGEQAKLQAQAAKEQAAADKNRLQAGIEKLNYGSQLLAGATPENWQQIRQEFGQMTGQDLGEQFDANKVGALMQQGLQMKDRLANEWRQKGYELDVAQFGEQQRHNRTAEGISYMNAQNRGDESRYTTIQGQDGYYFVDPKNPSAPPIPIKTGEGTQIIKPVSDKAFTLDQSNSATFGKRAAQADAALQEVGTKYNPMAILAKSAAGGVPVVGGFLETEANSALTPEEQVVEQAQRNFLSAVLRKESGATIGPSEYENGVKQYFPQPGDSDAVLAKKAQNRATAIAGLRNSAGPAWMDDMPNAPKAPQEKPPFWDRMTPEDQAAWMEDQ